jgi:hypothetical protein
MKTMDILKKGFLLVAMAAVCITASASKRTHFRHAPKPKVETVVVVKEVKTPVKHKHHHKSAKKVVKKVIIIKK